MYELAYTLKQSEPTSIHLTSKPDHVKDQNSNLTNFSPNEYHGANQETNNVIFDIRDKVDNSKVIMEIFVAMIGLYNVCCNRFCEITGLSINKIYVGILH